MPRAPIDDVLGGHARRLRTLETQARDDRSARHASAATLAATLGELTACLDALRQGTASLERRVDALQVSVDLACAERAAELAALRASCDASFASRERAFARQAARDEAPDSESGDTP